MDDEFSRAFNNLTLLNEIELEVLGKACLERAKAKREKRREGLRDKLLENLQKAIGDILQNDFTLTIQNDERDCHDDYGCVVFSPDENYSIEIE